MSEIIDSLLAYAAHYIAYCDPMPLEHLSEHPGIVVNPRAHRIDGIREFLDLLEHLLRRHASQTVRKPDVRYGDSPLFTLGQRIHEGIKLIPLGQIVLFQAGREDPESPIDTLRAIPALALDTRKPTSMAA